MRPRHSAESLGDVVRHYRVRAALTQDQLAAKAAISARSIRAIEQGEVGKPRRESLLRLARALGLDPQETAGFLATKRTVAAPAAAVTISILGPLEVARHGVPVALSAAQQLLIGLLALESDRVMAVEEIADVLWPVDPPDSWRNRIQVHMAAVRSLLAPDRSDRLVATERGGYRLQAPAGVLDADRFLALVDEAAAAELRDHGVARDLYEEALACWRGRVLAGLDDRVSARPATHGLHRARLTATMAYADLATSTGEAARAIPWLVDLAAEEMLNESLHCRYMTALAACGQQDQAMRVYHDLRDRLSSELGVFPSDQTQTAYRAILQAGASTPQARPLPPPAQLPLAPPVFGGRDETSDLLLGHLRRSPATPEIPAPRIVVVHGMPGVGKTALALRVSHAIRSSYPDGQLYADLRGESAHPTQPAFVLSYFLRALGVAANDIPSDVDEQSSMLRTYLAGRRVLMVLDDAWSAAQVLPLLPASPGNDVLITSRNTLIELPVTRMALGPLSMDASLKVLAMYLTDGGPAPAEAASRIAAYCGGLPLALRIAAGRAADGEDLPALAEAMRSSADRLTELRVGGLALPSSLASAYQRLSPAAQTALRRLALLPTRTIPSWAVHVVLDVDAAAAEPTTRELVGTHLLNPAGDTHYRFHDLVRLFGAAQTDATDEAARDQVLLHLMHMGEAAANRQLLRRLRLEGLAVPAPDRPITPVVDAETWFDAEYRNILDAVQFCVEQGRTRWAAGLLNSVLPSLRTRYLHDEMRHYVALLWERTTNGVDDIAHAYACEATAMLHLVVTESYTDGIALCDKAIEIFTASGDHRGRAMIQYHWQYFARRLRASYETGVPDEVTDTLNEIIEAYPLHRDPGIVAAAHQAFGVIHREYLKDTEGSIAHLEQALQFHPDQTTREYDQILYSLAKAYVRQGRHAEAEPLLIRALQFVKARRDHANAVAVLTKLSDIWEPDQAAAALDEAEEVARITENPWYTGNVWRARSRLAERTGDIPGAIRAMEAAGRSYERLTVPHAITNVRAALERLRALLGG